MKFVDVLFPLLVCIIAGTAVFYFNTIVLNLGYRTMLYPGCNPEIESCFTVSCEEGEECEPEPYKKVLVATDRLRACEDDTCVEELCATASSICEIIWCQEENLEEGEECFVYVAPEPIEEALEEESE